MPISTLICGRNSPNDWRTPIASVTMKAAQAMTIHGRFMGESAGEDMCRGCAGRPLASSELSYDLVYSLFRHPGLDPGTITPAKQWTPDQVERATCLRSEEHTSELQSLMRISYAVFC